MANDYEVGYGKPPKHTRFKKGQSGNPKGRPKGRRNLGTYVRELMQSKIKVSKNGKRKVVSSLEALLLRLWERALNGDLRALVQIIELARQYNDEALEIGDEAPLDIEDQEILRNHEARVRRRTLDSDDPCA